MAPAMQFWLLQVTIPATGLALLILGHRLASPLMMDAGVLVLAVAAIGSGAACVLLRRITFARRGWGFELWVWHGVAAQFIGASLIVVGAALAAAALVHLSGANSTSMLTAIRARPGLALVPVGAALLLGGIGAFVGFREAGEVGRGTLWNFVPSIPDRIAGVILMAFGGAALALGLYELWAPEAFDRSIEAFLRAGHMP